MLASVIQQLADHIRLLCRLLAPNSGNAPPLENEHNWMTAVAQEEYLSDPSFLCRTEQEKAEPVF